MDKEKIRHQIILNLVWARHHRFFMEYYSRIGNTELVANSRRYYADHVRLAHRLGRQLRSM